MDSTSLVLPNVRWLGSYQLGRWCIVGELPAQPRADIETIIGADATIRSHTVIYAGNRIGCSFHTGHGALIREDNEIGDNVSIGSHSVIEHHVKIADGVRIHSNVFIPEFSVLEEGAWIGPSVTFTNARYPRSPRAKAELIGPTIGRNSKIGANCTLLPGVRIGENCLIGAGSLVACDIPDNTVAFGHPARPRKQISELPYT